ncbi:hypothetical protein CALCODRAFT_359452 [Calocera cornea HHB12733]|uniref:Uncharacterized protein n=1 Tax=Calocera cornea HHB12733 TaxID=1353952 RepID=A0A165ELY3_9BASI|nr:hypothetical protein CALCODRAFT_359452 [Calocera cornea HHB12733]
MLARRLWCCTVLHIISPYPFQQRTLAAPLDWRAESCANLLPTSGQDTTVRRTGIPLLLASCRTVRAYQDAVLEAAKRASCPQRVPEEDAPTPGTVTHLVLAFHHPLPLPLQCGSQTPRPPCGILARQGCDPLLMNE